MSYKKGSRNPASQKTQAHEMYSKLLKEGKPANEAAKIAQEKTGISLVTGRQIVKTLQTYARDYVGQYR